MSFLNKNKDKENSNNILCRKNVLYIIFILLFCIIIYCEKYSVYGETYKSEHMTDKYIVEKKIQQLIDEDSKPIKEKLIDSCKSGMINGFLSGMLGGSFNGCIIGSASYGIINPMIVYIEYMNSSKKI